MHSRLIISFSLSIIALSSVAFAADQDSVECAKIREAKDRLACYDNLLPQQPTPLRSYMTLAWNLDNQTDDDKNFNMGRLRTYRQNYFLLSGMDHINAAPSTPAPAHLTPIPYDYDRVEAKFQLSFKGDMWNHTFAHSMLGAQNMRLWLGYTQQSHWQMFNGRNSSPFRETNYEPELITTFGTGAYDGLKLVNLGFNHQSNGQSGAFSRSWNRVYAQGGWEWDRWQNNLSVLARAWYRLPESALNDDNPDLLDYLGRGDVVLRWEPEDKSQAISILLRNNLSMTANHGFYQINWSLPHPMGNSARAHLQLSSGYGESLVDYNHHQTMIGFGFSFREW
jgi:phospholipase A1